MFYQRFIISMVIILLSIFSYLHAQSHVQHIDDFESQDALENWEVKSFVGFTSYKILQEDSNSVVCAEADSSASGLFKEIEYRLTDWPVLSWRWKVMEIPDSGDVRSKETDDYGARVYVVFPRFLKWKTKTITYIWSRTLPQGEAVPNPWLPDHVVMISAQSGTDSLGHWITETHDVLSDYQHYFGDDPPKAGAVAFMTDGDNTGDRARACYDDFRLLRRMP